MRNSARRTDCFVFVVAWLFVIVVTGGKATAQTRPPIEAAMREVQARHQALLSGAPFYYASSSPPRYWPPCDPEGDGGGPAFPPDGYYDQWFDSGVTDEQRYELAEHVLGCLYKILGEDGDGYGEGEGYLKSTWQDPEGMTQSEWDDQDRDHTWSDFVAFSGTDLSGPLYVYNQVDADNFEAVVESVIDYCQAHLTHLPLSATFTACNLAVTNNSEDSCVSPGCAGDTSCGLDHFIAEADVINVVHTQDSSCEGVSAWATWTGRPTADPATWEWSSPINYVSNGGSPTAIAPFAGITHFYLALEVYEDDILEFPPPPVEPDEMYHYFEKQYSLTSDQEIAGTYVAGDRPRYPWTCDTAPLDEFEDAEDAYVRYGWRSLLPPSVGAPGGVIAVFEPFFGHLDVCPSDCADSTDLDPKGEQSDENGEDDDCGSNSQAESEDPVMLSTGEKHERVTDVTVRLRGRDFALSREYTSRGSYRSSSSGNLVGQGWSANVFQCLTPAGTEQADDVLALSGPPMNYIRKFFEVASSDPRTWEPHGPSKQRVEATAIRITHTANPNELDSIYTVYALKEPGQWTKYYYRIPEEGEGDSYSGYFAVPGENISTDMEGLLLAEVDPTGRNTWVYTYLSLNGAAGMPRLCCVYLNPALSGNAGFSALDASLSTIGARALARFHWYWGDNDSREGKLARVDIERFVGNTTSTAVEQTVAYTYAEGSTVDDDVGDDAMLVQVAHSVQVDAAPLGVDPVWTRYTQYRYHDGATAEGAFDTEGEDGALKLVILPEQIEYYANARTSTGWDPEEAVAMAAAELLSMADGDEEDGLSPVDLAAKVVGYDTGRVSVQYLQSSCGCGGSAAQGLRQVFTYSGPYDTNGLSTRIQEQTYDGDSWEDYRIRYVDQRRYGTGAVPYKVIEALHDPISGRTWANHYVYDTTGGTRTMLKHYTPSAIASYTPYSASPSTFPSVTLETSGGLAYQYDYNAEKRRTTYEYDELGRPSETTSPTGHITKNAAYDVLGRVLEVQSGTASGLSTVQKMFYDDPDGFTPTDSDQEQGVGNGTLSWVEEYTGEGSEIRRTRFLYDDRDRRVSAKTPLPPYEWVTYDNLDRVTARAVFNGDTNFPTAINAPLADRGMLSETFYSQRGLAYSTRIAIDATDSTPDYLSSHSWFDENGRMIGTLQPNGPHSKRAYDGLGRVTADYITDRNGDAAPGASGNYDDVADIVEVAESLDRVRGVNLTDDRVIEQSTSKYDDSGNLILSTRTQRIHSISDSITGALDEESGISTYVGYIYDAADRMVATVNYGVNTGGTIFEAGGDEPTVPDTLPGSAPSGSLMSVVEYNSRGLTHRAYDTAGKATEYRYDDLGRRIAVIENAQEDPDDVELEWYIPGSPSTTNPARWRVTAGLDKDNVDWNRVTSTGISEQPSISRDRVECVGKHGGSSCRNGRTRGVGCWTR
ncbi:MAG: hypothetical protein IT439_06315 [Phycisphaerales bacterium]|nr:hypothetical protein [Phycisphaerales bacterium]